MNTPLKIVAVAAALAASCMGTALAQPQILASTDNPISLMTITRTSCTSTSCVPAGLTTPLPPVYAGGVAHDPRDRGTFVTDGQVLVKVNPRTGCAPICGPIPFPGLGAGLYVTGLAFNESTQTLFASVSNNTLRRYTVGNVSCTGGSCTLTFQNQCALTVPVNHLVSGLATDDASNRIIYASAPWLGPSPFGALVYEASQTTPCVLTCGPTQLNDCNNLPIGTVTGLGYDPCGAQLFACDGRPFLFQFTRNAGCTYVANNCCFAFPPGVRSTGLCVLPETEVSVGGPCRAGLVPVCNQTHTLSGDATIGNSSFALRLSTAPGASLYVAAFDIGPCFALGWLPLLCRTVPPNFWCNGLTTGVCNACNGTACCPFPLPLNPALCGTQVSSLFFGLHFPCAGFNLADNWASNCVQWVISGT